MRNLYSSLMLRAIKTEYSFFPSLGLVSKKNSGSHKDMNFKTFQKSYKAFIPYFKEIDNNLESINTFNQLKQIGFKYEQIMFKKTKDINTHKGLIFCCGIFYFCFKKSKMLSLDFETYLLQFCKELSRIPRPVSKSNSMVEKYNLKHAIDYAIEGYKIVFETYMFYKKLNIKDENIKLFTTLIHLTINLDDTTLINKIGFENWLEIKQSYIKVENQLINNELTFEEILEINQQAINNNISPGGCADILVLVIFLDLINYS
ncbi:triphosphoribosyl-dephospho-CoA synthase [Spiroplasma chinense]|uniref:triphosphoribosyl-dephospho-CoA synthase n=1 Tax=Spiroplasma chinense TaxID=216932 RepID=A0A5B9Y5A6_9MOLU|nr:triphosphoribosyl-dephospho-CoA synthase [Spiroplasma chinense]QEH61437.1 triphosphoribosyl-dephospho-CoA synthase [Spiroplasma chinense]